MIFKSVSRQLFLEARDLIVEALAILERDRLGPNSGVGANNSTAIESRSPSSVPKAS